MNASKLTRSPNLTSACPIIAGESKRLMSELIFVEDRENDTTTTPKEGKEIVREIEGLVESIGLIIGYRITQMKESQNLVKRIKLLPLFIDEIKEMSGPFSNLTLSCLRSLRMALLSAKKLLRTCAQGSKIYLALECEMIMGMFHLVNAKLSEVVDDIPYDDLSISSQVKEQMELLSVQLKRAKRRTDTQDMELAMDMMVVFSREDDRNADIAMIERLAKKLELHKVDDLVTETKAVSRFANDKRIEEHIQIIVNVLNKFRQLAGIEEVNLLDNAIHKNSQPLKCPTVEIPKDFLCPIALEIMMDPVIVATGQTYERESIQKWFDSNHQTCPKSGQTLPHLSLTPNYALKNLITQWREKNNVQLLPKKTPSLQQSEVTFSPELKQRVMDLIEDLSSPKLEVKKEAVLKIRLLSKESPENRILIAESQGIPPLIRLLSNTDMKVKEHAVTALLNLSIDDANKRLITEGNAIPAIIEVLENGNAGTKENAAAALFSLSMLEDNKIAVGVSNGIPPLVDLLANGTVRGKRDAATALFNLSLNHVNKARAIEAGVVNPLRRLLEDKELGMIDESLSILLLLTSHPLGRQEIGQQTFIETLVNFIGDEDRTPKNKEGAAAILYELGLNGGSSFLLAALQFGVYEYLVEMAQNGTNRAQRKASSIMQLMRQYEQIP